MAPPLVQLKDIALTFGGTPLLTGAELSVAPGERVSLVGRNGSGKSTLLKIAARLIEPDRGTVFIQPGSVVSYLPQEADFSGFASTLAYVAAGLHPSDDTHAARHLLEQLGVTGRRIPGICPAAKRAAGLGLNRLVRAAVGRRRYPAKRSGARGRLLSPSADVHPIRQEKFHAFPQSAHHVAARIRSVLHGSDYARRDRRVAHATTSVRRGPQHRGSDP
jgi:energy-coupling factor transporter ATP-binding protein EcfA2